jgi:hypothetical protein
MRESGASGRAARVTGKHRLKADRTELARFVEGNPKYAEDGTAVVLRTASGRLADEPERRR